MQLFLPTTLNRYVYGSGDPVNHVDPTGDVAVGDADPPEPVPPFEAASTIFGDGSYALDGINTLIGYTAGATYRFDNIRWKETTGWFWKTDHPEVRAVRNMFSRLQTALGGDKTGCATFMAGYGGTKRLQEKMTWMLNDNRIGVATFTSLDGTLPPQAIAYDQRIVVNDRGTFFGGRQTFADFFGYRNGSERAETLLLLHELAHVIGVIPDDSIIPGQSVKNSTDIIAKCGAMIGTFKP